MLTDAKIKAAKPADKDYKLGDHGQLYLLVSKAGNKLWRMNYTFGRSARGKPSQKTLTIGSYPAVTPLKARAVRDDAKAMLRDGRDPSAVKQEKAAAKEERANHTFESVALLWFELKSGWSVELFRAWRSLRQGWWHLDMRTG